MDRATVFDAWAPRSSAWTPWVKPVLFAHMGESDAAGPALVRPSWAHADALALTDSSPTYRTSAQRRKPAVVVDLSGVDSVAAGIALAEIGFRPVPLFAAVPSLGSAVPMDDVMSALVRGATHLARMTIASDAAPAFLLDARRAGSAEVRVGQFDNRSITFPTDFPSSAKLRSAGVDAVVLVQAGLKPQWDIEGTLAALQRNGFAIDLLDVSGDAVAKRIDVRSPGIVARFRLWWQRASLSPNEGGGFGKWRTAPHGG